LAKYQQVQNTYISTFQTLGALGLLLGTFGLAAVQIRSVLERQKELGLMRSVGFSRRQLGRLVLLENVWLLATGLVVGVGSALVTTLPHYFVGGASVPWLELAGLFGIILAFGLASAALASRIIARLPLIQSLRV
jgi:ABC-type antimicrobial peptide transport system permease subunit